MRRILITGGSGMLGSYVTAQALTAGWDTWATYSVHPVELAGCHPVQLDIRDATAVRAVFEDARPDVVVHTAALVKPDVCEEHKTDAFAINVLGTANVIAAAETVSARLIHISTDTIFDGNHSPIPTDATSSPINYYGETKAAAEAAVRASKLDWAIVRTSIIYGPRLFPWLESFTDKIVRGLQTGQEFPAFVDQYRAPIPAWNLTDGILEIADRGLTGVFHVACPETTSRFQFTRKVAEVFGLDTRLITPLYMDEQNPPARRSKMLLLDTVSTQRALNTRLLSFEEGVLELRERLNIQAIRFV